MTYGETIKRAREAQRLTQEQLAEALGVTRQAVSKWEADLSRPARSKLERLSEVLEVPPETWAAIDEELAAEAQPPDRTRPWKWAAAVLAVLCLGLCAVLAAVLWRQAHPGTLVPSAEAQADGQAADRPLTLSEVFPESLPLQADHDFDFGDVPLGEYASDLVPFLDDPMQVEDESLWSGVFDNADFPVWLNVVKTNPYFSNGSAFYDFYLLCALPDSAGRLNWQILTRLAEENCYLETFSAEPFANVLGHSGWKLSIVVGASAGTLDYYFIQRPDSTPCLMTTGSNAVEFDVDEDGVLEIISVDEIPLFCEIVDTEAGQEGAFRYMLNPSGDGLSNVRLSFAPEKGGFVVTDSHDAVLTRYLLRDRVLARSAVTDFSVQDYLDVVGTKIQFITGDVGMLSEGWDPESVVYNGEYRISRRQQAYLALQELYRLTGRKVETCYCLANEFGVLFSTLPDGFNQRSFFTLDFPEDCGGVGFIPSLHIAWRELDNDWSPLSLEEAVLPGPEVPPETVLTWYYDRLHIFRTGEVALETGGVPGERNLYLEDGSLFVGYFQDTDRGPVLTDLLGPYPDGVVNH